MGETCCTARKKYENEPDSQLKPEENAFKRIESYDFDKYLPEGTPTMTQMLNNLFKCEVGPIMLMEFKKFMFLVKMKLQESQRTVTSRASESTVKEEKSFTSMMAPPMIDQVWVTLISHEEVYREFCMKIFGGYVERRDPSHISNSINESYSTTLRMFTKYKDVIKPQHCLWPCYENDDYEFEYKHIVYVPFNTIRDLENLNRKYIQMCRESNSISKCKDACEYLYESF